MVFKDEPNHILINYIYDYPKLNLLHYAKLVIEEMGKRNIKMSCKLAYRMNSYFGTNYNSLELKEDNPFPKHHTDRYLLQCFYNLQEKYDRGQKDFDKERYARLERFINGK